MDDALFYIKVERGNLKKTGPLTNRFRTFKEAEQTLIRFLKQTERVLHKATVPPVEDRRTR